MRKYKWVEDKRYIGHGIFWDRGRLVEEDNSNIDYHYKGYKGEDRSKEVFILYISALLIYVLGISYLIGMLLYVI